MSAMLTSLEIEQLHGVLQAEVGRVQRELAQLQAELQAPPTSDARWRAATEELIRLKTDFLAQGRALVAKLAGILNDRAAGRREKLHRLQARRAA
jgi:hypothetical protein